MLADGTSPITFPELTARADELTRPDTCRELANILLHLLEAAEEPACNWTAHGIDPPIRSQAILAARAELHGLIRRLTEPPAAHVQTLARLAWLVHDPRSPIYHATDGPEVCDWARCIHDAMEPTLTR